jgi:hypothetical protein
MSADNLDARLKAAKTKKAEIEARRAAKAAEVASLAEVEAAEREAREAEIIESAESEIGPIGEKIAVVRSQLGMIIVRRCHKNVFQRFTDAASFKTKDYLQLVSGSVVHPDKATFDAMLEEAPGILVACADAVLRLADAAAQVQSEKSEAS